MRKGFTLLELLVVLAIISIIAALVGANIAGSLSGTNLKTSAKRISASLRYARSQATVQRIAYKALFDFEQNRFIIESGKEASVEEEATFVETRKGLSATEDEDLEGGGIKTPKRKTYDLPDGVRFEKATSGQDEFDSGLFQIVFFPTGSCTGGEITLVNDRKRRYGIRVDFITGSVRLNDNPES